VNLLRYFQKYLLDAGIHSQLLNGSSSVDTTKKWKKTQQNQKENHHLLEPVDLDSVGSSSTLIAFESYRIYELRKPWVC